MGTAQTPVEVKEAKQLGLTVWHVTVNGTVVHTFMSEQGALTKAKSLNQKLAGL